MSQEQICNTIHTMSHEDLDAVKKMIAAEEKSRYDDMWWTHDRIDDYLYIVHYRDGSTHLSCKGKDSYEEYMKEDDALWIERKTKNLFPVKEFLMRKETA